ncbi:hypothetical protein B1T45_24540 [Mycobacterium kansasii]|uniref:FAD-dependent oxidoreductase n=3 Tax=Mycobacterium kansasii TaxID=1768 RepID=U5X1G9_MYCKA|nr:hypothetical protein MKAN_05030 [Mycobacterium kansasii ATCC 12478]ARG63893.1 hypothetical protein B1T45_24540 [Mycobacterium kansasii]EUA01572.1 putative fAD-dependent oxidoreductase [Mycobacterium kansasii 824]EUA20057.1 putative fAD-dependent oxidoreductase [Mycobacterium kansasii 662]ARG71537.1 hypothetical protein B1T47_23875 [Mycobacterium kansasii]
MELQGQPVEVDLTRLPSPHQHIALVPQRDLLESLATAAQTERTFRLLRSSEVTGLLGGDDGSSVSTRRPARVPARR